MKKEHVASIYVIEDQRVLLIMHPKLQKWLPPGGHLEENELPHEAALRELEEETGILATLQEDNSLKIDEWNAKSLPRPFLTLLEEIPSFGTTPPHQHIDHIYLGRLNHLPARLGPLQCQWFSREEVEALKTDVEIFKETVEVVKAALKEEQEFVNL